MSAFENRRVNIQWGEMMTLHLPILFVCYLFVLLYIYCMHACMYVRMYVSLYV
jgi:hypothetical protein